MSKRNFSKEFWTIVSGIRQETKIAVASEDPGLVEFYAGLMDGSRRVLPEAHGLIAAEASAVHNLSDEEYRRTLGRCVGHLAGIKTGRDYFYGEA